MVAERRSAWRLSLASANNGLKNLRKGQIQMFIAFFYRQSFFEEHFFESTFAILGISNFRNRWSQGESK